LNATTSIYVFSCYFFPGRKSKQIGKRESSDPPPHFALPAFDERLGDLQAMAAMISDMSDLAPLGIVQLIAFLFDIN